MRTKNNIFAAAFDEMKRRKIVKTQKELALRMGVSEDTITRILRDRTEVTEDIITKLQTASGCIFNLQWLRGEDPFHMLAIDVEKSLQPADDPIESSSAANAAIAARDEIIASLYAQLEDKDRQIEKLYEDKEEMKKAKDETISSLRQHIQTLQSIIDKQRQNAMNYQFPLGVAEKKDYVKK
jgi:transcriptional regulator with XRE-family HTH domain